ncbi:hypothetical protein [Streptomyces sp. NBRC 109706]|uniref:hypothetical protein n=1 Tax=Streptomyces sp. NBRC 109706 TaxID=1550035 RepID=UPI0007834B7A|nr:hypothetical protein [Streptomyces sp. NBRC 109706]
MADLTTMVVVWGGPWLLGTSVLLGTTGMAVTAGVRAVWRRVRPPAEVEQQLGPRARLAGICLDWGLGPDETRELLERHLATAAHPSRGGRCGCWRAETTQEITQPDPDGPTLTVSMPEARRG